MRLYVGQLPPGERFAFDASVRGVYQPEAIPRLWYDHSRASLNPDAVRYVDNLLATTP